MPITSANEKPCSTSPPKRKSESTVRKVSPEVSTVRLSVWLMLRFTRSASGSRRLNRRFSRMSRREPLADLVNRSINQTLSRTVLTSGLTFLTVLSLFLFGGEVLHGFSFALVIGILIGTYSSIAVAAPMLVAWQEWRAGQGRAAALPAAKRARV